MNDEVTLTKLGVDGADIVCDIARIGMGYIWQIGMTIAISSAKFAVHNTYFVPPLMWQVVKGTFTLGKDMVFNSVTIFTKISPHIIAMGTPFATNEFHKYMAKNTTTEKAEREITQQIVNLTEENYEGSGKWMQVLLKKITIAEIMDTFKAFLKEIMGLFMAVLGCMYKMCCSTRTREQKTKNIDPPTPAKNKPRTPPKNDKPRSARAKSPSKSQSQVQKRKTK